jgi:hypothetical protein
MNLSYPNSALRLRRAVDCGDHEALMQCAEIEASIESVRECSCAPKSDQQTGVMRVEN